jgi:hypothetical protein
VELTTKALLAAADVLEICSKLFISFVRFEFFNSFEVALLVSFVEFADVTIDVGWAEIGC